MKIFSYFTICSMLCCGAFYSENTLGMNNFNAENLVLSNAAAFAENSRTNPAASALMNFIKSNGIRLSILHDLHDQLGAMGYTVTETPTNTGYSYNVTFSPLKYHQYKNGGVAPQNAAPTSTINARKKPTIAANRVNTNMAANSNNRQLNELKKSIDGLSELIQGLIQSVDELKESINQDNADDHEDGHEETCGVENPED